MNSAESSLHVSSRLAQRLGWVVAVVLFASLRMARGENPVILGERGTARFLGTIHLKQAAEAPRLASLESAPRDWFPHPKVPHGNLPVPAEEARLARERNKAGGLPTLTSQSGGTVQLADLDPSPLPFASFTGIEDDGTSAVPDTSGAVGTEFVMTVLNSQIRVQRRNGEIVTTLPLDSFFWDFGRDIFTYDPRCLYDPYANRWIITVAANPSVPTAGLVLAVSATQDPTGNWYRYYFNADAGGQLFAYSPAVGFNRKWIAIQANLFDQFSGNFSHSLILAVDRTNVYAGGEGFFARMKLNGDDYGGNHIPATTMDPNLDELHFVKNWAGSLKNPQTGQNEGWLRIFTLSGALGAEQLTAGSYITTGVETTNSPFNWADASNGNSDLGRQNGITNQIYLGDSQIQSVMYRGGTLWCSHTVLLPTAAPTRSAVQWWEFYPEGRLFQRHLIDDTSGTWSYAYPSLAVNNHYDVMVGYSAFSSAVYPSAYYRMYPSDGIFNNPQADQLIRSGRGTYLEDYQGNNRWGDVSATCIDPLNDGAFWTLQEYSIEPTAQDTGRWEVAWAAATPAYDLELSILPSTTGVVVGQQLGWTLTISNRIRSFAYNTRVSMAIPEGLTLLSTTTTSGVVTVSGGVLSWEIPQVGLTPLQCSVLGQVNGFSTQVVAQATAVAVGNDGNSSNNTASASVALVNAAPIVPPALEVTASDSGWVVQWPIGYFGFQLESSDTLDGTSWVAVNSAPIPNGGSQQVQVQGAAQSRFFRLRRQP